MAQQNAPDWDAELQVYEPHRAGLPALRPYFRDLWGRLPFAAEFSRSGIKAAHSQTVFGQIWLVLNPTLLAAVYFFLINVLGGGGGMERFAHIAGGIFVFYYFSGAVASGATSVTGGGRLILNMAFPRLLMPLAAVRTAFFRFLPTIPVYLLLLILAQPPWSFTMLLGFVFLIMLTLFSMGMAALFAAVQVYFRDTSSFLPYFLRIWLYVSPVLWYPEQAREKFPDLANLMELNPLYSLIGGWSDLTLRGVVPPTSMWVAGAAWAVVSLVLGSLFFMSRERDFAVRI
ncbi:MAG: ABC transporter permease [Actinomycetales bacterium]|jgi:teichoic acid transport system permease protein|nr:ABC transporter permease [Actinomycetales bacterium]